MNYQLTTHCDTPVMFPIECKNEIMLMYRKTPVAPSLMDIMNTLKQNPPKETKNDVDITQ